LTRRRTGLENIARIIENIHNHHHAEQENGLLQQNILLAALKSPHGEKHRSQLHCPWLAEQAYSNYAAI
jgi:hypothetical protein